MSSRIIKLILVIFCGLLSACGSSSGQNSTSTPQSMYITNAFGESNAPGSLGTISKYQANNGTLKLISTESADYAPSAVTVSGNYAYALYTLIESIESDTVITTGKISSYKFNNDGTLNLISSESTAYIPYAITIEDNYAYVVSYLAPESDSNESLPLISNITTYHINNGTLNRTSSESAPGIVSAISILDGYAYATVLNVNIGNNSDSTSSTLATTPASPAIANAVASTSTNCSNPVTLGSNTYCVSTKNESSSSGLILEYKINDGVLKLESAIPTNPFPITITISGKFAYVLNLANESAIESFVKYSSSSNSSNSSIVPILNSLYGNISAYQINDDGTLGLISVESTGLFPSAIAVSGNYAYVTNAFGDTFGLGIGKGTISTYQIKNGVLTKLASTIDTGYIPSSITILDNYAYVTNALGEREQFGTIGIGSISTYQINNGVLTKMGEDIETGYCPSGMLYCGIVSLIYNGILNN